METTNRSRHPDDGDDKEIWILKLVTILLKSGRPGMEITYYYIY